jgi:hypothetical protein
MLSSQPEGHPRHRLGRRLTVSLGPTSGANRVQPTQRVVRPFISVGKRRDFLRRGRPDVAGARRRSPARLSLARLNHTAAAPGRVSSSVRYRPVWGWRRRRTQYLLREDRVSHSPGPDCSCLVRLPLASPVVQVFDFVTRYPSRYLQKRVSSRASQPG